MVVPEGREGRDEANPELARGSAAAGAPANTRKAGETRPVPRIPGACHGGPGVLEHLCRGGVFLNKLVKLGAGAAFHEPHVPPRAVAPHL